jgi:hypothetical protein
MAACTSSRLHAGAFDAIKSSSIRMTANSWRADMSEENENKTIMIRRSPAGEAEPPQPAVQPNAKQPAPKKEETSWLKSPLAIVGIVIAVAVVAFVLIKMTGK